MQLLGDASLAALVPALARVLLVGPVEDELRSTLAARRCEFRAYDPSVSGADYDAAIVVGFPADIASPVSLLRELASGLASEGRLIVDSSRVAADAVRSAVGDVSGDDALLYGKRSVVALLEEAGLEILPSAPSDRVLEAVVKTSAPAAKPLGVTARPFAPEAAAPPDENARLAYAERELAELRAFFKVIHDNQRRLQEELANARAGVGERDIEIAKLRAEILRSIVRTPEEDQRDRTIALRDAELREVKGRVADLETRVVRLREALVELRDGPSQASTE